MSLEAKIEELNTNIVALTAALKSAGAAAGAAGGKPDAGGKSGKGGKNSDDAGSKPKFTREQVNAALVKVKDAHGAEEAKKIIADAAGVSKMADIKDAKFEAVVAACEKRLGGDGDDSGDDNL